MYFVVGFVPVNGNLSSLATRTLPATLRMNDTTNPSQPDYNTTFSPLFKGATPIQSTVYDLPYINATQLTDPFFPYGFRRRFCGPQTPSITADYLAKITTTMKEYINTLLSRGEVPVSTSFIVQYTHPRLNGNLPPSNADTAWPRAIAGPKGSSHQLGLALKMTPLLSALLPSLDQITYDRQADVGEKIADYPNYISPGEKGSRDWGENLERLGGEV
jgi:hypothetical protein